MNDFSYSLQALLRRPLPEMKRQIVVNVGPNQVRLEEFNRGAAPLQNNIARERAAILDQGPIYSRAALR